MNKWDQKSRGHHACPTCYGPPSSRRGFLAGVGALGLASAIPAVAVHGQTKPALIDTHLHFYPPEYQKLWLGYEDARKQPHFPGQVAWTREKLVEDMDRNGIPQASCRSPPRQACGSTSGRRKPAGSRAPATSTRRT